MDVHECAVSGRLRVFFQQLHSSRVNNIVVVVFFVVGALVTVTSQLWGLNIGEVYLPSPGSGSGRPFELELLYPRSTQAKQLVRHTNEAGGSVDVRRLTWQGSTGKDASMELCHFQDICIASRSEATHPLRYFLAADVDEEVAPVEVSKAFETCFRNKTQHTIGYKDLGNHKGNVSWINGHTWGILKVERGNHPAAWHGAWSRMLSAAASAADIFAQHHVTAQNFFSHFQLFEESMKPNGWAQFVLQTHSQAAQAALSGGAYASFFNPSLSSSGWESRSSHQPRWADDSLFKRSTTEAGKALTCFESVWLSTGRYYRSPDHALYYRKFAYTSLGLPAERQRGCSVGQLQAVMLVRNRPLWNMEEMFTLMEEYGLRVQYASVDENTPYQDQVDLFANTDILVSVHGSHLNNQAYMEAGSVVIEVFPAQYYHDEQKRLAKSDGVWHIEMRDQPYPPQEVVERKGKEYLDNWNKTQELKKTYTTTEACMKKYGCRWVTSPSYHCYHVLTTGKCSAPHRNLGAYADMAQFRVITEDIVSKLTNTPGCAKKE